MKQTIWYLHFYKKKSSELNSDIKIQQTSVLFADASSHLNKTRDANNSLSSRVVKQVSSTKLVRIYSNKNINVKAFPDLSGLINTCTYKLTQTKYKR